MTAENQSAPRQERAWSNLAVAFGSLKRPLSGGRRHQAAYQESRTLIYSPPMWDQITKYLQKQKREAWEEQMGAALELEGEALDQLQAGLKCLEGEARDTETYQVALAMIQDAKPDLALAKKHFKRLNRHGKPEEKRSSWGQMGGLSHQEALSTMGRLLIKPEVDPKTGTESELGRLQTYKRLKNTMKRVRKAIRAQGGKAR
jgi:hypothetical protein